MEKYLLIIDDNVEIMDVIEDVLDGIFSKIMRAKTVEEAQNFLSQYVFSYAILDINLEGRNGAEVIKYLVDRPENKNNTCPFVIVSGIINPQFIERNRNRFAGILMKPFDHSELREMVLNSFKTAQLPEENEEEISEGDIPYLKCSLPFPIVQLEQKVNKILDQVKKNAKLKQLFAQMNVDRNGDNFLHAHIGMLINVSTGIAIQMEWNTDKTLEKFVYASYLHDMALQKRPDLARIKSLEELESLKDTLAPMDFKLVFEHPNIAARTLEDMSGIPQDVAMIIRQHHEMPKENGFPLKLSHNKIAPLSVVFIVAHDLTHYVMENPNWTIAAYLAKAKIKFKGSHFQKVLSSLNEIK